MVLIKVKNNLFGDLAEMDSPIPILLHTLTGGGVWVQKNDLERPPN